MPSRPLGRIFRENSGFMEIITRTLGTITCAGRGGVICRPVIAERGLSVASHLVGLTVEGWHSQTTYIAMPEKLWFPRNRGTNITENAQKRHAAGTLFGLVLFRLSGVGDPVGFVVHTSAFTAQSSAIPGKLWFLGNFNSNIGHYNMCR